MWLSGQQKRPVDNGEGQTGIITMSGGETAVLLDRERRGLQVYSPGGYTWTPRVGQRVLVIQGQGEAPCVVGARQGGGAPDRVDVEARRAALKGDAVFVGGGQTAAVEGGQVALNGEIYVNGQTLEEYVTALIMKILGGA